MVFLIYDRKIIHFPDDQGEVGILHNVIKETVNQKHGKHPSDLATCKVSYRHKLFDIMLDGFMSFLGVVRYLNKNILLS